MKKTGPDSLCSWKVVAASFFIKFLSIGLAEISGLLMVASMSRYETTREEASLPYTLLYAIRNGVGPLIAHLGIILEIRLVTLLGCVVSFLSIAACFFVDSIYILTISYGVFFGFGLALESLLLNAILIEHFEQHISKAIGISTSGAQFGIFFFSITFEIFINNFGLSGTFLVISGIVLNALPAAFVIIFNKPNSNIQNKTIDTTRCSNSDTERIVDTSVVETSKQIESSTELSQINTKLDNYTINLLVNANNGINFKDIHIKTVYTCDKHFNSTECLKNENFEINHPKKKCDMEISSEISNKSVVNVSVKDLQMHERNNQTSINLLSFRKLSYSFDKEIPKYALEKVFEQSVKVLQNKKNELLNSKPILIRLFSDPVYILLLLSGGIYYFTIPAILTVLVDYAIDIGIEPSSARYCLTWAAFSELCGSFFLGWIPDSGLITGNGFAAFCFVGQCASLIIFAWCKHYIFLAFVITVFQLSQSGLTLIYPAIVSNSFEKALQSPAIASMYILAAPLVLTISPLIGYFRDHRGNYAGFFYILAAAAFIGFLAHVYILKLKRNKINVDNAI